MFNKAVAFVTFVLALSLQVNGHALVSPALGVSGTGARSDVQRPNARAGCGRNADVASTIDTSTPISAAADGTFTATVTNFNRLIDGSRKMSATVDPTGTGDSFDTEATVTQNGDPAPRTLGSEQLVAQLPAGMTCSGGAAGNLCLVSFKSTSGFGNCVVVSQGAAGTTGTAATNTTGTAAASTGASATGANSTTGSDSSATGDDAAGTAAGTGTDTTTGTTGTGIGAKLQDKLGNAVAKAQAGTRAPRAFLADLKARGEEAIQLRRRSWIWA